MPERARAAWWLIDEFGSRISGATVEVRNAANTAAITDTLYAADDPDGSVLPNPFTSDANGKAEAYLLNAKRAIFRFSKTGITTVDVPVDFTFPANRFLWRTLWVNTTAYVANDVVRYNGESWIALRASTGVTPVEGADWSLVAAKGELSQAAADARYQALSVVDAKGDLIVGTANDTTARHAAGSNGQILTFDSAQTDGLRNISFPAISLCTFLKAGALTVGRIPVTFPLVGDWTITAIKTMVDVAPTGASVIVDIDLNGTTIFTTQANRPTIAAGARISNTAVPDVTSAPASQFFLQATIDQIGSTAAGTDLTVTVYARPVL